jgi:hypothetical protein
MKLSGAGRGFALVLIAWCAPGCGTESGSDGSGADTTGTNWVADHIWTQHTLSGFWASGTGGTVENCRLQSIWADGCNVNNVSRGATVGNNLTVKNNGGFNATLSGNNW